MVARSLRPQLDRLVALITDAAAGELKLRLRTEIESAAQARPPRRPSAIFPSAPSPRAGAGRDDPPFCADPLRERPVAAGSTRSRWSDEIARDPSAEPSTAGSSGRSTTPAKACAASCGVEATRTAWAQGRVDLAERRDTAAP
jgi:hypothetical protein